MTVGPAPKTVPVTTGPPAAGSTSCGAVLRSGHRMADGPVPRSLARQNSPTSVLPCRRAARPVAGAPGQLGSGGRSGTTLLVQGVSWDCAATVSDEELSV